MRSTNGARQTMGTEVLRRTLTGHGNGIEIPPFSAQGTATVRCVAFITNTEAIAYDRVITAPMIITRAT